LVTDKIFFLSIVVLALIIPTTVHAQQCNMPDILNNNLLDVQKGGDYSNCDFREYYFEYCEYCDFENSKLTVDSMFNVLSNSYFKNANLPNSDFSGTNLSNSVFINADLSNSQIATEISHYRENIDFTGANLKDSTISSLRSSWTDSVFKNVNLNEAIISLKVNELDFSGSDWTNADVLHDGFFKNSNLSNGIFKGTYFIDTTFTNVDFSDSDFDNAIFFNVILDNVDFSNSKIENAVFYNVDLSKTNIQYVSEINIPERNVFCDRHESCNLLDWYEAPKVEHLNNNKSTTNIDTSEFEKIATEPTLVASTSLGIASFVDQTKDPQNYVDRYNNEPEYKKWFDTNYPQYESIEQAVGLELTKKIPTWIKSIFGFYSQDKISEDELLNAIQYLIDEKILKIN
jgi:uncharacterized protein YjbI with pentapeptide repeats